MISGYPKSRHLAPSPHTPEQEEQLCGDKQLLVAPVSTCVEHMFTSIIDTQKRHEPPLI
jgi:hypothetical protein